MWDLHDVLPHRNFEHSLPLSVEPFGLTPVELGGAGLSLRLVFDCHSWQCKPSSKE